jgi:hypothetical protein
LGLASSLTKLSVAVLAKRATAGSTTTAQQRQTPGGFCEQLLADAHTMSFRQRLQTSSETLADGLEFELIVVTV